MSSFLVLFFGLIGTVGVSAAEEIRADHVRVALLAPKKFAAQGTTIGVHFELDPGWHVYWKNPGDSGAAPKFNFIASGADLGPVQWPVPERIPIKHLTNIGYENEVVFPFAIYPKDQKIEIEARLEWLVCRVECIPGFGTLKLMRPVGSRVEWEPINFARVSRFLSQVPTINSAPPLTARRVSATKVAITFMDAPTEPDVFPLDGEAVSSRKPSAVRVGSGFELTLDTSEARQVASTGFVVKIADNAWEVPDLPIQPMPVAAESSPSLWALVLFSVIGGAILNLMPCVLPVLSIKVFSLLKTEPLRRRREGFLYSAGVLFAFAGLGGVFLLLRAGGQAVGWGFHLQAPLVVLSLTVLFWLMALNFLGVFEIGQRIMSWSGKSSSRSSFLTGLLSVFVAAPCTGPFMGSALGASATLPGSQAMLIFLGLGVGLALPFLALALSPSDSLAMRCLPKPGAWMETLKQFFAFPMFATVIWLLSVLDAQIGSTGWLGASMLLLTVSFSLWLGRSRVRSLRAFAWLIASVAFVFTSQQMTNAQGSLTSARPTALAWNPFSANEIRMARARKQPVFIDFTAAWCITCQINKKTALETESVMSLFRSQDVYLVRADWTRQDPSITEALAELGRNSVPVYAFYPADGGAVTLLPQILTLATIENLFSNANTMNTNKETPK